MQTETSSWEVINKNKFGCKMGVVKRIRVGCDLLSTSAVGL
jgi:hypothetical protein